MSFSDLQTLTCNNDQIQQQLGSIARRGLFSVGQKLCLNAHIASEALEMPSVLCYERLIQVVRAKRAPEILDSLPVRLRQTVWKATQRGPTGFTPPRQAAHVRRETRGSIPQQIPGPGA
ncbi:unnamed protein product [Gadus morhua 'NCC']